MYAQAMAQRERLPGLSDWPGSSTGETTKHVSCPDVALTQPPTAAISTLEAAPLALDALLARLAHGERAVFADVFERLWGPVFEFCRSLLRNEADASDAAQEALQKILERASHYDQRRPALTWAFAIAAWECRTLSRRRTRRREVAEEAAQACVGGDAEEEFIRRNLVQVAMAALGELTEADRDALMAGFGEEAASVSGATLRKRRERALPRLRKAFRRLYGLD